MIDLHCHILPGIDDGAKTVEDSLDLLREEQKQGTEKIIFTPHFNFERTTLEDFCAARELSIQRLNSALKSTDIDISFKYGAEVYFSLKILELDDITPLCLGGSDYILIEFSTSMKPYGLEMAMKKLLERGYTPVLAHIERYPYFAENIDMFCDLVSEGCLAQVNAETIIKRPSRTSFAMRCIQNGMVHVISSDCHSMKRRPPNLKAAFSVIDNKLGSEYSKWLTKNGEGIFDNSFLDVSIAKKPKKFLGKWL